MGNVPAKGGADLRSWPAKVRSVMIRRDFLAGALALPLIGRVPWAASPRFGCAAITWNGQDESAIDDIASLGFRGIQLRASAYQRWGSDPAALRGRLADRGLAFVALSSGTLRLAPETFDDDLALHLRHARFVREAGGTFLQVVDERPRDRAPVAADFAAMARRMDELGRRTADLGVTLAYHNHMGNLGQGAGDVEAVLSQCDPQRVRLLLDVAHWQAAGGDPVAAVKRHANRLAFLHLKDLQRLQGDAQRRPYRFVELGAGEVDVRGVLAALAQAGFGGWAVVELDAVTDPSRTPRGSAQLSKDFLAASGYPF